MMFFMIFIGLLSISFIVCRLVARMMQERKIFLSDKISGVLPQAGFWRRAWKNDGMKKRMMITLGIIFVYKLLGLVALPGVNGGVLMEFFQRVNAMAMAGMPGAHPVDISILGAAYRRFTLLAFGLMPYVSACLLVQIIAAMIPPVKQKIFSAQGRGRLVRITAVTAVVICGVQAFFHSVMLEKTMVGDLVIIGQPGMMFRAVAVMSLVSAFCLALWLARMITEKGVGQGIGVLVGVDVFIQIIFLLKFMFSKLAFENHLMIFYAVIFCMIIVIMMIVCCLTFWRRELTVAIGPAKEKIPLRLSRLAGVPVNFSSFLIALPAFLASFFPGGFWDRVDGFLTRGQIPFYFVLAALVSGIVYLYTAILISPEADAGMIKKYNGKLEGKDDALAVENRFYIEFEQLTMFIAVMMIVMVLLPDAVIALSGGYYTFASFFAIGGFLIVFGAMFDMMENLKAKMMRTETGCEYLSLTVTDEIEVSIKKCFLESNGISCVLEPLRFTWGLPVKTAADEYRLYIAESDAARASELLKG
jgi:preprotein translocase subunit SecY